MLTKGNQGLSDEVAFVFDGGNLLGGVDLVNVPLRLFLEVDLDLLRLHALGSCNQTHPLRARAGKEKASILS